ncbi:hypothetical protein SAMD00019534_084780 [Acytostelium subglobosum LB1]|uniref:hypothetical protein n=1 Tax=Acytostelium subglobosum LB1 TaxID=1410327 RepID=UPI0006448C20|nr:hypothetical protein SAMD00019534_084780 [Acytostelium subglobosum LB1]GAM25303.1 hypothetical protein SAMD00019534_084780 [Acytostelium subglobosum LB1]|eukprot:XP_012751823.1 hypothetical protein SAMD00019534_084780 [Acytostelium subglobosum LB1]
MQFLSKCNDFTIFNALYQAKRGYFINPECLLNAASGGSPEIVATLARQVNPTSFKRDSSYTGHILSICWSSRSYSLYFYVLEHVMDEHGVPLEEIQSKFRSQVQALLMSDIKMFGKVRRMASQSFLQAMTEYLAAHPEVLVMTEDKELIDQYANAHPHLLPAYAKIGPLAHLYWETCPKSDTVFRRQIDIGNIFKLDYETLENDALYRIKRSKQHLQEYGVDTRHLQKIKPGDKLFWDVCLLELMSQGKLEIKESILIISSVIKTSGVELVPYIVSHLSAKADRQEAVEINFNELCEWGSVQQVRIGMRHLEAQRKLSSVVKMKLWHTLNDAPHAVIEVVLEKLGTELCDLRKKDYTIRNPTAPILRDLADSVNFRYTQFSQVHYITDDDTIKYVLAHRHSCGVARLCLTAARFGYLDILQGIIGSSGQSFDQALSNALVGGHRNVIGYLLEVRPYLDQQDQLLLVKLNDVQLFDYVLDKLPRDAQIYTLHQFIDNPDLIKSFFEFGSTQLFQHVKQRYAKVYVQGQAHDQRQKMREKLAIGIHPKYTHYGNVDIIKFNIGHFVHSEEALKYAILHNRVEVFDLLFNKLMQMDQYFEESRSVTSRQRISGIFKENIILVKSDLYAIMWHGIQQHGLDVGLDPWIRLKKQKKLRYPDNGIWHSLALLNKRKCKELINHQRYMRRPSTPMPIQHDGADLKLILNNLGIIFIDVNK